MRYANALVVDDDMLQCELAEELLGQCGVRQVTLATSATQALERLRNGLRPQLIMCDLHMPGLDGFQFMREVARLQLGAQFLIMSGQEMHVLKSAGLLARLHDLACLGVIEKPLSASKIRQALDGQRSAPITELRHA